MTTRLLRLIVASLAVGATLVAHAESTPARVASERPLGPILAALDSDRDGTLSAREIATAPLTLAALDLNHDGLISPDELRATNLEGRPVRVSRGATSLNVVLTLDANHDGLIQTMEIANAVSSLKRLDLNADGELTPAELRPTLVAQHRVTRR